MYFFRRGTTMSRYKKHSGFTLIELVIVIVILGILAAAALPRFSDLSTDARVAAINGLAGSLRSAASIAHATQLAKGLSDNTTVTLEGTSIAMSGGYPTASAISQALSDFTNFTAVSVSFGSGFTPHAVQFRLNGRVDCSVSYTNSTNTYTVSITSTGSDPC